MAPPEYKSWSANIPLTEIKAALAKGLKIGDISKIDITGKGPSGRVTEFTITHSNGTTKISGPDFRILVGPDKMRSALIDSLTTANGNLSMKGKGFGHGVGMSQWGAYEMAKKGKKGPDIVKYYFKDIKIEKLWD
jgi:stage II sporulation protein D